MRRSSVRSRLLAPLSALSENLRQGFFIKSDIPLRDTMPQAPETPGKPKRDKHAPRGLTIIHEDRDIFVINKNAGVLSCETRHQEPYTAENVLTNYIRKGCASSYKRAYLVHRLDRETSGIMLFAKTEEMQQNLKNDWKNTEKLYLVAVYGHPKQPSGIFSSYLTENEDFRVYSVADPERGRFSETEYWVIGETETMTLLKVRLLSGRKNQIRVHFSEHGMPVVGDTKYNRDDPFADRLCLHSKSIEFNHPFNHKRCFFDTEIPPVFRKIARGFCEADWKNA